MEETSQSSTAPSESNGSSQAPKPFHNKRYSNNRGSGQQNMNKPKPMSKIRYTDRVYVPKSRAPAAGQQSVEPSANNTSDGNASVTPVMKKDSEKKRRKRGANRTNHEGKDEAAIKEGTEQAPRSKEDKPQRKPRNQANQNPKPESQAGEAGKGARPKRGKGKAPRGGRGGRDQRPEGKTQQVIFKQNECKRY